jgi:ATP-binding cassette subfamily B protein
VDGKDVGSLGDGAWLQRIGYVSQDTFLFDRSVADNIRIGRPDASDDEVRAAARSAGADGFIAALPKGYDTRLQEAGSNLSGGQRQRIAIARALIRQSDLLILDEATSALDLETEAAIFATINALKGSRTVVIVTHRFAPLKIADTIYLLEDGRIVEQGSFEKLLAMRGRFYEMAGSNLYSEEAVARKARELALSGSRTK